jgi:poly-gamma-glutamate synthesis protein (capsule biosynthesis protein)
MLVSVIISPRSPNDIAPTSIPSIRPLHPRLSSNNGQPTAPKTVSEPIPPFRPQPSIAQPPPLAAPVISNASSEDLPFENPFADLIRCFEDDVEAAAKPATTATAAASPSALQTSYGAMQSGLIALGRACQRYPQVVAIAIALGTVVTILGHEPADRALSLGATVADRLTNLPKSARTLPSFTREAELLAVGDVMMHGQQIQAGYDPRAGTYNYNDFFQAVRDRLRAADWAVANLETVLDGGGAYTGYPLFNAPSSLADALKHAGFDVISTANNHSLDRGALGVQRTRQHLRDRGFVTIGTATTPEEAREIPIVQRNDIALAFLSYTFGTNGIPLPKGEGHWVALINLDRMLQDIGRARQLGADVIAVVLHFGSEYQRQPSREQQELVDRLLAAGADIILGSHPHVVQPYQVKTVVDGFGRPRLRAVIYSMGNFISNQEGLYRQLGVMFSVKIRKHFPQGRVEIAAVEAIPTWTQRYNAGGKRRFRTLALPQAVSDRTDPLLTPGDYGRLNVYLQTMQAHLQSMP